MDDTELLKFLEQIERLLANNSPKGIADVKGDSISLEGTNLTTWRNGWRLFSNLEKLRMTGVLEIENVTFEVNRQRLLQRIDEEKNNLRARQQDRRTTVAELFIKGNNLFIKVRIGEKDFERQVQRLNYGSNLHALLTYGLSHPGKMFTAEEVQAKREKNDSKLRDIADTLSKDKAKALAPLLDVFFDDVSRHTVTVRPMVSIGMYKAQSILHHYKK